MTTYFQAAELLAPPTARAAFSDRQAYVCAELSRLAYFKFEGGHALDEILEIARKAVGTAPGFRILEQQLRTVLSSSPSSSVDAESALGEILTTAGFELQRTFSTSGTQAFLCTKSITLPSGSPATTAFLVFRGTEPKDFEDIKTDARAKLVYVELDNETVAFHEGYLNAFNLVRSEISRSLDEISHDQLFISGHSLGGALAMVATRFLAPSINGACYTFGAPPIGDVRVQNGLKTPVYQVVNELDIVPRLPNPWMISGIVILLKLIRLIAKLVTVLEKLLASGTWDERLEHYIQSMTQYRHPGYVSYLVGSGDSAHLRYNISSFDRFRWWLSLLWKRRLWQFKKMVSDHSIDLYVDKLKTHALRRQNQMEKESAITSNVSKHFLDLIKKRTKKFPLAPNCRIELTAFIHAGTHEMASSNFLSDAEKLSDAETNLGRFLDAMIEEAVEQGYEVLHEDSFFAAKSRLCPLFPFC